MAGEAVGSIYFDLGLNTQGFMNQINQATNMATKNTTKSLSKINNSATSMFKGIGKTVATGLSIVAVTSFTKSCLNLGSNLAEVQNVVDTAFGNMSGQADKWAANAMTDFGMSETAAKKYLGVFGQMSSAMGITGQSALDMSKQVTGLTGDVASFYNISQDEAYTKLKSIWTGETESLKDLGVVMTQTNLDQYALNNGFGKTTAKMTQQEQAMLRFQYVTNALSNASGDFIKTQDSWANQTRVLTLRFEQFKATLGQGFIALFTPIVKGINSCLVGLQKLADGFTSVVSLITGTDISSSTGSVTSDLVGIGDEAANASGNISGIGDAAGDTAKEIEKSLAGFDQINKLSEPSTDSGSSSTSPGGALSGETGLVPGITGDTVSAASAITDFASKVKSALEPLKAISFDNLVNSFDNLKKAAEPLTDKLFSGLSWAYYNVFVPLSSWTIQDLIPAFFNLAAGGLTVFNSALDALQPLWSWAWDSFLKPIASWTGGVIVSVIDGLTKACYGVSDWIKNNQGTFDVMVITLGLFGTAWKGIDLLKFITNAGGVSGVIGKLTKTIKACTVEKIKDKIETLKICGLYAKDFAIGIGQSIKSLIQSTVQWGISTASKIADTAATAAHTAATWLGTAATTAFGVAMTVLTSPITLVIAALATLGIGIYALIKNWDTVSAAAGGCWDWIVEKWNVAGEWFNNTIIQPIGNFFDGLWSGLKNGASGAWDGIKSVFGSVTSWFGNTFAAAWQAVKNVFSAGGQIFTGIKDGILSGLKSVVNALISGINKVISIPFNGINTALNGIKNVNILGAKPFDWIPNIGVPQIPMLAQGGYVQPNTPQLAMIGDNRHQGEVVAPEDKLKAMALEAAQMSNGGVSQRQLERIIQLLMQIVDKIQSGDIIMQVGDQELARILSKGFTKYNRRYNKLSIEES